LELGLDVTFRAPFYPRDVGISVAPAIYIEMNVYSLPIRAGRHAAAAREVAIVLGFSRPGARIEVQGDRIAIDYTTELAYNRNSMLYPDPASGSGDGSGADSGGDSGGGAPPAAEDAASAPESLSHRVPCRERIVSCNEYAESDDSVLRWRVLPASAPTRIVAAWVAWVDEPVFQWRGRACRLLGSTQFDSLDSLARWATESHDELDVRARFLDSVFAAASLSKTQQNLIAFGFQSWLMNTWWVVDDGGMDWFVLWDGRGRRLSPLDAEFTHAPLYLALWPDLLGKILAQYLDFEQHADADGARAFASHGAFEHAVLSAASAATAEAVDDREDGSDTSDRIDGVDRESREDRDGIRLSDVPPSFLLPSDLGWGGHADESRAAFTAPVESACNYLLLLHVYWKWTGHFPLPEHRLDVLGRLLRFILQSDVTEDGFPDEGVINSFHDAPPSLYLARGQIYLGVKAICAARATVEMARSLKDEPLRAEAETFALRAIETLEREAWLGDRYAVCLDPSSSGLIDPRTNRQPPGRRMDGHNAWSTHTADGLLLPFLADLISGIDLDRMRRDAAGCLSHCGGEYGAPHTSACRQPPWMSSNLWRDMTAAYLELDLLSESERYWSFQIAQNRTEAGGCFVDSRGLLERDYSPRGAAAMGLVLAAMGLRLDGHALRIVLNPVRAPLRMPLLPFTDWERGVMPWVEWSLSQGRANCSIVNRELLESWRLEMGFTGARHLWQE
jgi:hypothetical protein